MTQQDEGITQQREQAQEAPTSTSFQRETQRRLQRNLRALQGLATLRDRSIGELATYVLEQMGPLSESKDGFFGFMNDGQDALIVHAWSRQTMTQCSIPDRLNVFPVDEAGVWADAIRQRRALIVNDYTGLPNKKGMPAGHVPILRLLVVPVVRDGKIAAVGAVANKNLDYTSDDAQQVESFLMSAMIVIEHRRAEEALTALRKRAAHRLLMSQEEERARIARDIHDDIGQRLAAQAVHIGRLLQDDVIKDAAIRERILDIHRATIGLTRDVQAISRQLHPSILDELGVADAIRTECARLASRTNLRIDCRVEPASRPPPKEIALCLYRVFQEALNNVVQHAQARTARVSLYADGDAIVFDCQDDGVGMDLAQARSGLGLVSMEERARLADGELVLKSDPGTGTNVRLTVPLEPGES